MKINWRYTVLLATHCLLQILVMAFLSIKKLLDPSYSLYGIKSPDFRCAAHAASGFVKRMEHPKQ